MIRGGTTNNPNWSFAKSLRHRRDFTSGSAFINLSFPVVKKLKKIKKMKRIFISKYFEWWLGNGSTCLEMGTGGSFLHNPEDDDIFGNDLNGSSHGVIKRIPVEIKPRGKLGIFSHGSSRNKRIGGSLQSALSVDLENPEAEKIKKEFEMYR